MPEPSTPTGEPALTRFLIYTTTDQGRTLTLVGDKLAKSSREAKAAFYEEPPASPLVAVAVSENHFKLTTIKAREPKTTIADETVVPPLDPPGPPPASSQGDPTHPVPRT